MKRILLALFISLPAFAQLTPAEMKTHVFTNLPSGSLVTAFRARDTFTNLIESVLFIDNNLSDLGSASTARSNLGLGALAVLADAPAGTLTGTTLAANVTASSLLSAAGGTFGTAAFTASGAYQPLDSDLTSIAALSTTSFGRGLLDDADAAAGRTSLGLGTLATQSGTFSGTSSGSNTGDQDLSSYATTAAVAAGYQPLDSDLTAIAALSTTSFGRGLLDDADASAGRTSLGVVIGTDVQAYDADLTTYAGISPSASVQALLGAATYQLFRIGLGVEPGTDVQAYDADLADLADGSLTGSKVGSGVDAGNITTGTLDSSRIDSDIVRKTWTQTLTGKRITPRALALSFSASLSFDTDTYDVIEVGAMTGNLTTLVISGTPTDGQTLRVSFQQDGTGGRTITWPAGVAFGTDYTSAMIPTTASAKWGLTLTYNSADAKWRVTAMARGF
jgi:hypothetical protein